MRLFIAVNFDEEVKSRLLSIRDRIKDQAEKGNFSRPDNLHLTLVFMGETPEELVQAICRVITEAVRHSGAAPFTLNFTRTGCFRHSSKELWWIGTDKNDPGLCCLNELRLRITAGLAEAGAAFDERPFNAHITLGREIKHAAPIELSDERITVPINRISLMKSEHIRGVLIYTEIFALNLG